VSHGALSENWSTCRWVACLCSFVERLLEAKAAARGGWEIQAVSRGVEEPRLLINSRMPQRLDLNAGEVKRQFASLEIANADAIYPLHLNGLRDLRAPGI
jgi:hypothetical protein